MTTELDDLWAVSSEAPSEGEGRRIGALVMEHSDLSTQIAMTETMLADLKDQMHKLLTEKLPEAMAAAGTSLFRTENGLLEVSVDTTVSGSLPSGDPEKGDPAKRAACLRYIEQNDGAGIIKADVILSFGRSNVEAARAVVRAHSDRDDCVTTLKEDIHPQTLMAWGRDRLKNGFAFEPEKANLWVGKKARIKEVKR